MPQVTITKIAEYDNAGKALPVEVEFKRWKSSVVEVYFWKLLIDGGEFGDGHAATLQEAQSDSESLWATLKVQLDALAAKKGAT